MTHFINVILIVLLSDPQHDFAIFFLNGHRLGVGWKQELVVPMGPHQLYEGPFIFIKITIIFSDIITITTITYIINVTTSGTVTMLSVQKSTALRASVQRSWHMNNATNMSGDDGDDGGINCWNYDICRILFICLVFLRARRRNKQPDMPLPVEGNLCQGCYGTVPYDGLVNNDKNMLINKQANSLDRPWLL